MVAININENQIGVNLIDVEIRLDRSALLSHSKYSRSFDHMKSRIYMLYKDILILI